jgi:hypothetical protein
LERKGDVVEILLRNGANINEKNVRNTSFLRQVIKGKQVETLGGREREQRGR